MIKYLFILIALVYSKYSFGIRFVGNGGGDAEMRVIEYMDNLMLWAQMCQIESRPCISGLEKEQYLQLEKHLKISNIQEVQFVNSADFSGEHLINSSGESRLVLTFSSLYFDLKHPRSDKEILRVLLMSINQHGAFDWDVASARIQILPKSKRHPNLEIYRFASSEISILFSTNPQLESLLQTHLPSGNFSILSETSDGYIFAKKYLGSLDSVQWQLRVLMNSSAGYQLSIQPFFVD